MFEGLTAFERLEKLGSMVTASCEITLPITYKGYNDKGEEICSRKGADANNRLNPEEVREKIIKIQEIIETNLKNIQNAVFGLAHSADIAVVAEGTKMGEPIEALGNEIANLGSYFSDIGNIYIYAVQSHNQLQDAANEEARSIVRSTAGVTSVR